MAWCPEYLKLLKATQYEARAEKHDNVTERGKIFNESLENVRYKNSKFINCKWVWTIFLSILIYIESKE